MKETLRQMMMTKHACWSCGSVDHNGGVDFAGSGLYWYCEKHLEQRSETIPTYWSKTIGQFVTIPEGSNQ